MGVKKVIIISIVIVIGGVSIAYFTLGKKGKVEYVTAKVERGQLVQTVSETGTVKSASEIDLNFLNSGKIAKILVKVGDKVKKDHVLAELDYSGLSIKQQEAQANLEIAQAKLAKLLAGASAEEIAVSQANVNQAKVNYDAAVQELEKVKNIVAENIAQAEKTLNDLKAKTDNDVTTYEQAVAVAQTNLDNIKSTYQRSIDNKEEVVLTTLENKLAVAKTALDIINTVVTDNDAKTVLSIKDSSYLENTNNSYDEAAGLLTAANNSLSTAEQNKTNSNINQAIDDALAVLNKTFTSLDYCYSALENSITSSDFTQTELDAYKTNIDTELTNISTAISAVQTAQQNLDDAILNYETNVANAEENLTKAQADLDNAILTAANALATARLSGEQQITAAQNKVDAAGEAWQVAKAELAKIKAPARIQDVALARAQVKQAQAALNSIKNQIDNSIIKAPISGTITKVEYGVGEQIQAAKPAISMLGENNFEIEVLVSEADIAKVKLNDPAEITLDAFGEDIKFNGKVYFIEPAETVIQDVIYYKVKISLAVDAVSAPSVQYHTLPAADLQQQASSGAGATSPVAAGHNIKSGMTANVVIITAKKDDVLIMPSRAVVERNGGDKIVRILVGRKINEVPVKLGLRGDGGMIEVLSGVKEGDEVVTFVKEKK